VSNALQLADDATEEEKAKAQRLPVPKGYYLLVALPEVKEKSDGGIVLLETTTERERVATMTGLVLAMGPEAYVDKSRFPSGPRCELGEWAVMEAYSGIRVKVDGKEFRLISDDQVKATVENPEGIITV
jgi:co-chaperonin GroES (HSP10)